MTNRIGQLGIFAAALLTSACSHFLEKKSPQNESGWTAVYKHDDNGNALAGDIDLLISGIRKGYAVRVGWGWQKNVRGSNLTLEHVATPIFLSVIQNRNVAVVIDAHPLLKSYVDINEQSLGADGHLWQCVLSTTGTFNAKVYHRTTGKLLKDWPQRHRMTWFLEYPHTIEPRRVDPLYR